MIETLVDDIREQGLRKATVKGEDNGIERLIHKEEREIERMRER